MCQISGEKCVENNREGLFAKKECKNKAQGDAFLTQGQEAKDS